MVAYPSTDPRHSAGQAETIQAYYDDFAKQYEAKRRTHIPNGYHALIDDLEVDIALRYADRGDLLEVGCGTGLLLERFAAVCRTARGVDLSPGMLSAAEKRGLDVRVASATELPFDDNSFDVVCSFKVLAHVPDLPRAITEMLRVTRPGGHVLAELYNPVSLRGLVKHLARPASISDKQHEGDVYTRFDLPWKFKRSIPRTGRFITARGVRIVTPAASVIDIPLLGTAIRKLEWSLCDTRLSALGGFWVAVIRKVS